MKRKLKKEFEKIKDQKPKPKYEYVFKFTKGNERKLEDKDKFKKLLTKKKGNEKDRNI